MNKQQLVSRLIPFFGTFMIVGAFLYLWRGGNELSAPGNAYL